MRRELNENDEAGDKSFAEKGRADLDAEALQLMRSLRFEPATRIDTITIPLTYRMQ